MTWNPIIVQHSQTSKPRNVNNSTYGKDLDNRNRFFCCKLLVTASGFIYNIRKSSSTTKKLWSNQLRDIGRKLRKLKYNYEKNMVRL